MYRHTDVAAAMFEAKRQTYIAHCKQSGMRLTHQRQEILRELVLAADHPSAEILFERVRRRIPPLSLDTVYRSLDAFETLGLISRVPAELPQARFDADTAPHFHLVCTHCGRVDDLAPEDFDPERLAGLAADWGQVREVSLVLRGICSPCCLSGATIRRSPINN